MFCYPKLSIAYDRDYTKKNYNNHGVFSAVMIDLSKAFDCISHEVLIAKLNAYDFNETSLKVVKLN